MINDILKRILLLPRGKASRRMAERPQDADDEFLCEFLKTVDDEMILDYFVQNILQREDALSLESRYGYARSFLPAGCDVYASQEGEDVLIRRILKQHYHQKGFYIDVGAHDPVRFSTTFHYYLKGWKGINIDPLPGMKKKFDSMRPRDTNIECAIGSSNEEVDYFVFKEPAFNTLSKEQSRSALKRSELIAVKRTKMVRLGDILESEVAPEQEITFMNIDVEGREYDVLTSFNLNKYRPKLICCEALSSFEQQRIESYVGDIGYSSVAGTKNSIIFCEQSFWDSVR